MRGNRRHGSTREPADVHSAPAQLCLELPSPLHSSHREALPPPPISTRRSGDTQSMAGAPTTTALCRRHPSGDRVATMDVDSVDHRVAPETDAVGRTPCSRQTIGSSPPSDTCSLSEVEIGVPIVQLLEIYEVLKPFVPGAQGLGIGQDRGEQPRCEPDSRSK